ncbi:hypothetical protein N4E61_14905, partial [Staphylococcus aureus]|nr:hypothetical protein [Staphylococcus aureus]
CEQSLSSSWQKCCLKILKLHNSLRQPVALRNAESITGIWLFCRSPDRSARMLSYIIRRLLLIIPTLFGIMLLNFLIVQAAPG